MMRMQSDDENLLLVASPTQVDDLNSTFYSRFPYPWPPQSFEFLSDPHLHTRLLNQNIGDWRHVAVPPNPRIWVAGCGTNQAIYVALRHPHGHVVGSDLSPASLDICGRTAKQLGIRNLQLRQESLNEVSYEGCFDVVICTGVIHHNANPAAALRTVARAMSRTAVLELMVYNRAHRPVCAAVQKAVRLLTSAEVLTLRLEDDLDTVRRLMDSFKVDNSVRALLQGHRRSPDAALADALIQPVEHSYTVASLVELASANGLEILAPALSEWDVISGRFGWHINFTDRLLQARFDALVDVDRWQVANLLLYEQSPLLWFYFQRVDADRRRQPQAAINDAFLDTVFTRVTATRGHYQRQPDNSYRRSLRRTPFPSAVPPPAVAALYRAVDGVRPVRALLDELGLATDFGSVLGYREQLTTSAFPFLVSTDSALAGTSH